MRFPSGELYSMERTKPLVQVDDTNEYIQWDYCDLEGVVPEIVPGTKTMSHMGKLPKGQWDNLPTTFFAINGGQYIIDNIITLRPNKQ